MFGGEDGGAVGEEGQFGAPLADEGEHVDGILTVGEDGDVLVAEFVAVAVGAIEDGVAPALCEAGDGGKDVADACGKEEATGGVGVAIGGADGEGICVGVGLGGDGFVSVVVDGGVGEDLL